MNYLVLLSYAIWRKVINYENLIILIVLFLGYHFVLKRDYFFFFFNQIFIRIEQQLARSFDGIQNTLNSNLNPEARTFWEIKKCNVAGYAIQGRRPYMEDRFNAIVNFENTKTSIYGVFDGHGGDFAAEFVEKNIFRRTMKMLVDGASSEEVSTILTEQVLSTDNELLKIAKEAKEISGTTLLVLVIGCGLMHVANVGDSRAVMCNQYGHAVPLTIDHKPNHPREKERIISAGGFISYVGVWRVAGILATSRALGDLPLKERSFLTAEPEISTYVLAEHEPRFVIVATDGLWDVVDNDEAVAYIADRLDEPHHGARSLALQAFYRGSMDNISILVITFDELSQSEHCLKSQSEEMTTDIPE